jgi:hypothetical protein
MLEVSEDLMPTNEQSQIYRDDFLLNGNKNSYVLQIVKSIRHYGRYIGQDLDLKYPRKTREELPSFLTELEIKQLLMSCQNAKEPLVKEMIFDVFRMPSISTKTKGEKEKATHQPSIFLSYCHKDKTFGQKLANNLEVAFSLHDYAEND